MRGGGSSGLGSSSIGGGGRGVGRKCHNDDKINDRAMKRKKKLFRLRRAI